MAVSYEFHHQTVTLTTVSSNSTLRHPQTVKSSVRFLYIYLFNKPKQAEKTFFQILPSTTCIFVTARIN